MSAFGGKADMTVCGNPLSRSLRRDCHFQIRQTGHAVLRCQCPFLTRSGLALELILVLNSASSAINFHPLHEGIVNGDNLSTDAAAVRVDIADFQPLVTKTINLRS